MKLRTFLMFAGVSGLVLTGGILSGCSGAAGSDDADGPGVDGKLEQLPDQLTGTSAAGPIATPGSATEVWAATNAWSDKSSAAAKAAGVAWEANSGLDWSQKFSAWIASFKQIDNADGYGGKTVQIPTPFGDRTLPGPTLECAEFGMMLRVTFSSWYHLPFYLTGWDATNKRTLYAGSFGFVSSSGAGVAGFPKYKTQYKDYESSWKSGDAWPTDSNLDKIHLAGGSGDNNAFIGSDDATNGAGAYFDQLFLNKRAAYFMRNLLDYFGSINLADSSNLIQVKAESIEVGDVMLERWQKEGIGHTIPIMAVATTPGHLAISAASGSMPRRQPLWEGNDDLVYTFTGDYTGGPSMSGDNVPYSHLGGGLHRWRTAVNRGGHWTNERGADDTDAYIAAGDYSSIEARPLKFQALMSNGSPESQRDAAIAAINDARTKLHSHPSSCSARTERENAFQSLYAVEQSSFSTSQADVDKQYRTLEDQVFSELDYTKSKTCCWDSTTDAMGALILQYAQSEQDQAQTDGVCKQPTVFEAEASSGDGYKRWADYAASQNQSSDWVNWSQDEPCSQAGVAQDTVTPRSTIAWCPR